MRILFISAAFLPEAIGGVELHLAGIAGAMARDHQVLVFCRGADAERPEFDLQRYAVGPVPVVRINYRWSDATGFTSIYRNPTIRARFEAVLDEFRPDVVHAHHLTCLSTDLLDAAHARGVRTVMTLHDFWMGCPRGQRMTPDLELCDEIVVERCRDCLARMWSGWFSPTAATGDAAVEGRLRDVAMLQRYHEWIRGVLGRVDQLITPSRSSRELFIRQGVDGGKIRVVENGLDHAPFRALRRVPHAGFRFGFIGSVLPTKGVHVLIDAFHRLGAADARLEIHGEACGWHEVTDYHARLQQLAAPAGDRIEFCGRYEPAQLPGILARLDVLVIPSLWFEAFCLTLREGFLAGVPVIVSALGAMAEGVEDGVTALCFAPGDAADLARQMGRLHADPALRTALAAAPKQVRTIEDNAGELMACYRSIGAGNA